MTAPRFRDHELAEAAAICERWAGRRSGQEVPCRSSLIGRELDVRVGRGMPQRVEVVACAVPRWTDKPSKRCKPAYLVKSGGLFPQYDVVDGGRVRNASRTPRPTHKAPSWEMVGGRFAYGPREAMAQNVMEGLDPLEGMDLPYPHRVGSHVCCPDHAANGHQLAGRVRDEYETEGELSAATRRQLAQLAAHLRKKHGADELPARVGPEDWQAAAAITSAGDSYCARLLDQWQTTQEESGAIRREEYRKAKARAKSRAKAKAKAIKTEGSRAVKALQRQTRRKAAAGITGWEPLR